jgi:hypothetical protein
MLRVDCRKHDKIIGVIANAPDDLRKGRNTESLRAMRFIHGKRRTPSDPTGALWLQSLEETTASNLEDLHR